MYLFCPLLPSSLHPISSQLFSRSHLTATAKGQFFFSQLHPLPPCPPPESGFCSGLASLASPAGAAPSGVEAETLTACCDLQGSACVSLGGSCAASGSWLQPEALHCGGLELLQWSPQSGWVPQLLPHAAISVASARPEESCHGHGSQELGL